MSFTHSSLITPPLHLFTSYPLNLITNFHHIFLLFTIHSPRQSLTRSHHSLDLEHQDDSDNEKAGSDYEEGSEADFERSPAAASNGGIELRPPSGGSQSSNPLPLNTSNQPGPPSHANMNTEMYGDGDGDVGMNMDMSLILNAPVDASDYAESPSPDLPPIPSSRKQNRNGGSQGRDASLTDRFTEGEEEGDIGDDNGDGDADDYVSNTNTTRLARNPDSHWVSPNTTLKSPTHKHISIIIRPPLSLLPHVIRSSGGKRIAIRLPMAMTMAMAMAMERRARVKTKI
jgi:hypothetical protein